jgi:phosphoenolpyruvate---glycerone phosphotransferase subunit DhaL
MNERIGKVEVARVFVEAAKSLRSQHERLSELDSIAGDGDHGTTMLRVAEQLERAFDGSSPKSLASLLRDAGWDVLSVDGGASSALLGTFFTGMADAGMGKDSMDCHELAETFQSGLRAVSKQTKAQPGDKTMMDALVPAVDALRSADSIGKTVADALQQAAEAARSGAEATKDLVARYGRAKFLGEKTRGHADPGAASVALLFDGFSAAFATDRQS